jgi:hypothetical protein
LFEQHARWLEELREYIDRKEPVTCSAGYMPLTAITLEITAAGADPRPHDGVYIDSWTSMAGDLADSLQWIGHELLALVDTAARSVHQAITNGLLVPRAGAARPRIDDTQRPAVARRAAALAALLDRDDALVAAWRDLVAGCQDINHVLYPSERIAFLRDTVVGLSEYRRQDRGYFSPLSTAVQVLMGYASSVQQAQAMVGDPVDPRLDDPQARVNLTDSELADLAERCILKRRPTGQYVVWFRLSPGYFLGSDPYVTHGGITFYEAQSLATLLIQQDRAHEVLGGVVPEELLTQEIRDLQLSNKVDDTTGFEYLPALVYARVEVRDVERHLAVATARTHLDAVLAVVGHTDGMWEVLGGHLFFDGSPWAPSIPRWGLKHPLPEPDFYQNDHFVKDLADFSANGHLITADIADAVQPAFRLSAALKNTPRTDAEGTVMAAVRAIEHCNTWIAPTGGLRWYTFIDQYLTDGYTLTVFARRVVFDVFAAVQQYRPDHTPGASTPPELAVIEADILLDGGWGTRIDSPKTIAHVATLRGIYADHWLARRLAESDEILTSPATISTAFDEERRRVDARVKRLTRSRNAAIHGGTLSKEACATITDLAAVLAQDALNTSIWARVTGRPPEAYATSRADEHRQRIANLKNGGDLTNLFTLTP